MWFSEILHIKRSNTCLCKEETCFICLRGEQYVLWGYVPIFLLVYCIHNLELYLFIICNCFPHSVHNVFVKCFQEDKYGANQDIRF